METYSKTYELSTVLPQYPLSHYGKQGKRLGGGAYGEVYLYSDVAIKIATSEKIDERQAITAPTIIEIGLLKRLHHPNIIEIIDVITEIGKGAVALVGVVQPAGQGDLHSILREGKLTVPERDLISYQLLCGVAYLNSRHVIHGDLKPSNIIFYSTQEIRIADFGLSIPFACLPDPNWLNTIYTIWYRAPELLLSTRANYTLYADTWATALILYELYVTPWKPLFPVNTVSGLMTRIEKVLGTPGVADNWPEAASLPLYQQPTEIIKPDREFIRKKLKNDEVASIISAMLVYDPEERLSSYFALRDPYFDSVRSVDNESEDIDCYVSHKTRDRYPVLYYSNMTYLDQTAIESGLDYLVSLLIRQKGLLKSYLVAVQLLDEYLSRSLLFELDQLPELIAVILGIATNIVKPGERSILRLVQINPLAYNKLRLKVLVALNYDTIFTVAIDYDGEHSHYGLNDQAWALAQALIMAMTFGLAKFTLLPHEIFTLAAAVAILVETEVPPASVELREMLDQYGETLAEELDDVTNHSNAASYFIRLSGGRLIGEIKGIIDNYFLGEKLR